MLFRIKYEPSRIKRAIFGRKPRYSEKFKPLMERISTKGDLTGRGDFSTFGAFYQTFMYAYIIGLRLGKKTPLTNDDKKVEFADISHWKPTPIRDFNVICLRTPLSCHRLSEVFFYLISGL